MIRPAKYRKRPVVIEAMFYDGFNYDKISEWMVDAGGQAPEFFPGTKQLVVTTLEGPMAAFPGTYIIRGVEGEFYPCKATVFHQTYEMVPCEAEGSRWQG